MKQIGLLAAVVVCATLVLPRLAAAQTAPAIPPSITTPDRVQSRLGTLDFKDGMPSPATLAKVYDNLDFTHAVNAFMNTFQGVNMAAARKGILAVGVKDNEIGVFSELMDAKSLFLTANADTVYFFGFIDLTKGPIVFETPPGALGVLDDMWWRWVTDFGLPGPDRGLGGKYLLLPPGYDGPLPEGGYFVARSRTTRVVILGRLFMENNDPKPPADLIRKTTKIYPYEAGGVGTSIAEFLDGGIKLGRVTPPPPTVFHELSGKVINTIPPNDFGFYEMLNEVVQQEPATSLDPELMGAVAAIGIIKGKPFAPDERMKKILTEALAVANATSRTLFVNPRAADWYYYPGSAWMNPLFVSGSEFETPIPMITREGAKPFPPTGYRTLDARSAFFYGVTGITPGDEHAADRHRLAISLCELGRGQAVFRRRQDLQGDGAEERSSGKILVVHALRQPDALDARHAAALPARGQPKLSVARRRTGRRRLNDGLLQSDPARGGQAGQLDTDRSQKGLVHDPAPLQPARAVLHKSVAAERDRVGEVVAGRETPAAASTLAVSREEILS